MTDNIDAPPEEHPKAKGSDDEEEKLENQDWQYYFKPAQATKLLTKRFVSMGSFILLYYLI